MPRDLPCQTPCQSIQPFTLFAPPEMSRPMPSTVAQAVRAAQSASKISVFIIIVMLVS